MRQATNSTSLSDNLHLHLHKAASLPPHEACFGPHQTYTESSDDYKDALAAFPSRTTYTASCLFSRRQIHKALLHDSRALSQNSQPGVLNSLQLPATLSHLLGSLAQPSSSPAASLQGLHRLLDPHDALPAPLPASALPGPAAEPASASAAQAGVEPQNAWLRGLSIPPYINFNVCLVSDSSQNRICHLMHAITA